MRLFLAAVLDDVSVGLRVRWKYVLTDLETHVACGRIDVGVAAEILVDDVLILAGTGLLRRLEERFCAGLFTLTGPFLLQSC